MTTRLSDVIVPSIFAGYTAEQSVVQNKLITSGIVQVSPALSALLAGGGITFNVPGFQHTDESNTAALVPSDDPAVIATPEKVTARSQVAIRLMRNKVWASTDLVSVLTGADPLAAAAMMAGQAQNKIRQTSLVNMLAGTINETRASVLVNTIASETVSGQGAGTKFSTGALIDTLTGWGDNASNSGAALAMHSDVYRSLQKANLITFLPNNVQDIGFGTYLGFTVLVDDGLGKRAGTTDGFVYTIYVLRQGGIQLGVGSADTPVEIERSALAGNSAGLESLIVRDVFTYHINGYAWAGSAALPADAALATASNWSKVFSDKQVGVAALVCNI